MLSPLRSLSVKSVSHILCVIFVLSIVFPIHTQTLPYISDIDGEDMKTPDRTESGDESRLFGTFKLFNPDTVPFYLWVSFERGGKFTHAKYGDELPSVRAVELELRYKNVLGQTIVKKFSNNRSVPVLRKRFGGSWLGGGRSEKRKKRGRVAEEEEEVEVTTDAGRRGRGVYEVTFWKEDAQGYYEMELWGVLYAPDLKKAIVAGNYVENIKFDIETVR